MTHAPPDFRSALHQAEAAAGSLGLAVRTALGPILPESGGARSCGRALGLERTLGWKVWTIAHSSDLATILRMLPGRRGWTQVLAALRRRGAEGPAVDAVRTAADRMQDLLGDLRRRPALLRAIGAGGLDRAEERERMVAARRKAARSNERVYGVHTDRAVVAALLAPDGKGGLALACTTIFDRLSRSRPGLPWPLYARLATLDTRRGTRRLGTPVDPHATLAPLVSDLSGPEGIPGATAGAITVGERDGTAFLHVADLSTAEGGNARIATAEFVRGAGRRQPGQADPIHLRWGCYLPTDLLVFDVLVHRSLPKSTEPSPWLCGTPLSIRSLDGWHDEARLPLEAEAKEIPATELAKTLGSAGPAHLDVVRRTALALGTGLEEFVTHRVRIPFPPLFGSVFMSFELAPAASEVRTRRRERRDERE